jgi:hypothetical protein|nr:MAG TPA: hypothetical protein [Caudoviricetes sp.]
MATAQKHRERSCYSYHNKPDFTGFHRKAAIKTTSKAKKSLAETFLGMFKRQKKGDK